MEKQKHIYSDLHEFSPSVLPRTCLTLYTTFWNQMKRFDLHGIHWLLD